MKTKTIIAAVLILSTTLMAQPTSKYLIGDGWTTDTGIEIFVGPGKEVRMTVPDFAPESLRNMLVSFLSKGDAVSAQNLENLFRQSPDLTIVMTTKSKYP